MKKEEKIYLKKLIKKIFHFNMLKVTQILMQKYGLLPIKSYEIKGKTGNYTVEILNNGVMKCNCIAGSIGKECRHKRILRNILKGEKYEH